MVVLCQYFADATKGIKATNKLQMEWLPTLIKNTQWTLKGTCPYRLLTTQTPM